MGKYAVTGGASGIGAAVVGQLTDAGHSVIVLDLYNADINTDLSTGNGRLQAISALEGMVPEGLDGFVPCAGVSGVQAPPLVTSLNYFGVVSLVDGLRANLAKKSGAVVLISSVTSSMASDDELVNAMLEGDEEKAGQLSGAGSGDQAYAATKRAVTCWMRRNCADFLKDQVRINAVAPGYIDTPLNDGIREAGGSDILDQFVASIPVGRPGQPEDIANLISFLLSDKSSFIAGANIFIDGGHDALFRQDSF
ncbi:MAG: SDR family oxidoreductase [Pseudomonadales bacterium]